MNDLTYFLQHLMTTMPFEINVMVALIVLTYIIMPIFGFIFVIHAIWRTKKKKPARQSLISAFICLVVTLSSAYIVSKNYINTSFTPYIIGEEIKHEAIKHDLLDVDLRLKMQSLDAETVKTIETCNQPYEVDGKYVMPRLFNLMQCLGLK